MKLDWGVGGKVIYAWMPEGSVAASVRELSVQAFVSLVKSLPEATSAFLEMADFFTGAAIFGLSEIA